VQARITKFLLWAATRTIFVTKFRAMCEKVFLERGRQKG